MKREDAFVIGGLGMVGKATMKSLDIPYYYDLKDSNITLAEGAKKKWCFICLPTPTDEKNEQAKSIDVIREYIRQIKEMGNPIFVVRSTVLPGTCRALAEMTGAVVCSNPEFLSEATWEKDAMKPMMKVLGADEVAIRRGLEEVWQGVKSKINISTNTVTAEMMKYTFNTFATVKNAFGNNIFDLSQIVGADYEVIRSALHRHPWGSKNHFRVFDKGGRGAGGRCLPKDLKAFAKWSNLELFKVVDKINDNYLNQSNKR